MVQRLAHELRNPLVAVHTFTQFLRDRYDDPELRRFFYETVLEEVERLNRLLQRLTELAQPIQYRFGPMEVLEWLDAGWQSEVQT